MRQQVRPLDCILLYITTFSNTRMNLREPHHSTANVTPIHTTPRLREEFDLEISIPFTVTLLVSLLMEGVRINDLKLKYQNDREATIPTRKKPKRWCSFQTPLFSKLDSWTVHIIQRRWWLLFIRCCCRRRVFKDDFRRSGKSIISAKRFKPLPKSNSSSSESDSPGCESERFPSIISSSTNLSFSVDKIVLLFLKLGIEGVDLELTGGLKSLRNCCPCTGETLLEGERTNQPPHQNP